MRNEIEALLRAVDYVIDRNPCTMNESECECYTHEIQRAAATVRASLSPKPVPDGELLPCPFCGGRPQIVTYGGDAGSFQGGRFVACMICESASLVCWGDEAADRRIAEAWNRRASLAREPVEQRVESLDRAIREWASSTFPMATIHSHLRHMRKEIDEAEAEPGDVMEWADLLIMTLYAAALGGHSFAELIDATERKHEINVAREWGEPDEYGVVEHVRELERAELSDDDLRSIYHKASHGATTTKGLRAVARAARGESK